MASSSPLSITPALLNSTCSAPKVDSAKATIASHPSPVDDVGAERHAPAARGGDPTGCLLGCRLVEVDGHHRRPLGGEQQRRLLADPPAGAGDERHLLVEPSHQILSK